MEQIDDVTSISRIYIFYVVSCVNYRFTNEEVKDKVESYRAMLMGSDVKPATPQDEFGRVK